MTFEEAEKLLKIACAKQVPQKPYYREGEEYWFCPRCREDYYAEENNQYNYKYCPNCGQAIDWSEKNESND